MQLIFEYESLHYLYAFFRASSNKKSSYGNIMRTHWTSKNQKSVISERREQLDLLFEFANTDLTAAKIDQLKNQMCGFLKLMMAEQPAIDSVALSTEKIELIQKLQKHLNARLKK